MNANLSGHGCRPCSMSDSGWKRTQNRGASEAEASSLTFWAALKCLWKPSVAHGINLSGRKGLALTYGVLPSI